MVTSIRKGASRVVRFALCLALPNLASCGRSPAGGAPSVSAVASHPAPPAAAPIVERLCAGRTGCTVRQRRPLLEQGELVDLAIARAANQESCDGSEYWLVRAGTAALLATDCDAQDGADTRAHANVRVDSEYVLVDYEEGLSSDLCAGSSTRVRQRDFGIADERRWGGTGKNGSCVRSSERVIDWQAQKHDARWSSRACSGRPANSAHTGTAIPAYEVAGVSAPSALGSCAATIGGTAPSAVQMRVAVVNAALLVEVSGVKGGALSLTVAGHSPDDGFLGSVGCGTQDEYGLATTTIDLETGHVTAHDKRAPNLEVSGRDGSSIRLYAPALAGVERIALAYRGVDGAHLETAGLSAHPTVSELPPLDTWFQNKEPCELRAAHLEARTPMGPQPLLRLAGW